MPFQSWSAWLGSPGAVLGGLWWLQAVIWKTEQVTVTPPKEKWEHHFFPVSCAYWYLTLQQKERSLRGCLVTHLSHCQLGAPVKLKLWHTAVIPALDRLKWKDLGFYASLGYLAAFGGGQRIDKKRKEAMEKDRTRGREGKRERRKGEGGKPPIFWSPALTPLSRSVMGTLKLHSSAEPGQFPLACKCEQELSSWGSQPSSPLITP